MHKGQDWQTKVICVEGMQGCGEIPEAAQFKGIFFPTILVIYLSFLLTSSSMYFYYIIYL